MGSNVPFNPDSPSIALPTSINNNESSHVTNQKPIETKTSILATNRLISSQEDPTQSTHNIKGSVENPDSQLLNKKIDEQAQSIMPKLDIDSMSDDAILEMFENEEYLNLDEALQLKFSSRIDEITEKSNETVLEKEAAAETEVKSRDTTLVKEKVIDKKVNLATEEVLKISTEPEVAKFLGKYSIAININSGNGVNLLENPEEIHGLMDEHGQPAEDIIFIDPHTAEAAIPEHLRHRFKAGDKILATINGQPTEFTIKGTKLISKNDFRNIFSTIFQSKTLIQTTQKNEKKDVDHAVRTVGTHLVTTIKKSLIKKSKTDDDKVAITPDVINLLLAIVAELAKDRRKILERRKETKIQKEADKAHQYKAEDIKTAELKTDMIRHVQRQRYNIRSL